MAALNSNLWKLRLQGIRWEYPEQIKREFLTSEAFKIILPSLLPPTYLTAGNALDCTNPFAKIWNSSQPYKSPLHNHHRAPCRVLRNLGVSVLCFITLTTSNKYLTNCACSSVPEAQEMWGDSSSLIPTFSGLTSAFNFDTHTHTHTITVTFLISKLQYHCIKIVSYSGSGFICTSKFKLIWKTTIQSWNKLGLHVLKTQNQCEYVHSTSLIIKIRK